MTTVEKRWLTVDEAAAEAGISRPTAYKLVRDGVFPSFRVGRKIRVPRQPFLQLLNTGTVATAETPRG